MTNLSVTILGSGTSTGVPVIGCTCEVCQSGEPKNIRTRASVLISFVSDGAKKNIVVDTGPDFRHQMLRENVSSLEAVLYTHIHADHCHGFDDLRSFYFLSGKPVPCFIAEHFLQEFRERFSYAFQSTGYKGTKPQVDLSPFPEDPMTIGGLEIDWALFPHGNVQTAGFRFGNVAYVTDFKGFPPEVVERWRGKVEILIASGIYLNRPHVTHNTVPETLKIMDELAVKRGVIGHLPHDIDYLRDSKELPSHVEFAYDGMVIDVQDQLD